MTIEVLMPALSPTMTEGNLAKWVKKEGDRVESGDVIAEIETDKATMEVESVDEGVLGKILVPEGTENVKVNEIIALILEEGEAKESLNSYKPQTAQQPSTEQPSCPAPASTTNEKTVQAERDDVSGCTSNERVFATPLARRVASNHGLDINAVKGTGPYGRIVRSDVEQAMNSSSNVGNFIGQGERKAPTLIKVSQMRKTIARRLTESKQQVPHFYLTIDCELDNLLSVRKKINARDESLKITVNDFVIKAVAHALMEVPSANASWNEDGVMQYYDADVSVAVAVDGGLITPIVSAAQTMGLREISSKTKDLIKRANEGKLQPAEFQGGTFTVSNLGMYGIKNFNAIINPPQGCILAIGTGEPRPVVRDGSVVVATVMSVTLSVDHRVVDGVVGAKFLAAFKRFIEEPAVMLA